MTHSVPDTPRTQHGDSPLRLVPRFPTDEIIPTRLWVPLAGVAAAVSAVHLHAAFSGWFDHAESRRTGDTGDPHHRLVKPYTITPVTRRGAEWGVEIGILTLEALQDFAVAALANTTIRLGRRSVRVGEIQRLHAAGWGDLARWRGQHEWTMRFLTPTVFRSGQVGSPLPTASVVLRSPSEAWDRYSPLPSMRLSHAEQASLHVHDLDLRTAGVKLYGQHHRGAVGWVTYRCADPAAATKVNALFELAGFCGVGSFTTKGMGVVEVDCG